MRIDRPKRVRLSSSSLEDSQDSLMTPPPVIPILNNWPEPSSNKETVTELEETVDVRKLKEESVPDRIEDLFEQRA